MTVTRWEVREVSDLAEAVRRLADFHVKSLAQVVQTPQGKYVISPDRSGDGTRNRHVVSRGQLATFVWATAVRDAYT